MTARKGFYPCCGNDIAEPLRLLRDLVDEVVFCDIRISLQQEWGEIVAQLPPGLPIPRFVIGDVRSVIRDIDRIDVLFYRGDSAGEGGSGVFVFGDVFLPSLLARLSPTGALFITTGVNSRGGIFPRMVRPNGLVRHGWRFSRAREQTFLLEHGLHTVTATPIATA